MSDSTIFGTIKPKTFDPKVKIQFIQVTPELAKQWLKNNPVNRKMRQTHTERLVKAIRNGDWGTCLDPIIFGEAPAYFLLNGQHRLSAIVEAQVTLPLMVITGVSSITGIDTGAARTTFDRLYVLNPLNTKPIVSVACKLITDWGVDDYVFDAPLEECLDKYRVALTDGCSVAQKFAKRRNFGLPIAVALVRAAQTIEVETLERFMDILTRAAVNVEAEHFDPTTEYAPVKLVNNLNRYRKDYGDGHKSRLAMERTTERAIKAFVEQKKRFTAVAVGDFPETLYPLL